MKSMILPVLPLRNVIVFPHTVYPLFVDRPGSVEAVETAVRNDKTIFLLAQKDPEIELPDEEDFFEVGTVCSVLQVSRVQEGHMKILVEGQIAAIPMSFQSEGNLLKTLVEPISVKRKRGKRITALRRTILRLFQKYFELSDNVPEELYHSIRGIEEDLSLADAVSNYCDFRIEDKHAILSTLDFEKRLMSLSRVLSEETDLLEMENQILNEVKQRVGKNQKEFFLNEQLRVIEEELGINPDEKSEAGELRERIEESGMSEEAARKAERELVRLQKMAPVSPEATVSRTYIEWLCDLPWKKKTKDNLSLDRAQKMLDSGHYGLKKVKERILEYLAVHQVVKNPKGPILCFVGPPGVGKTSLARSIAGALGRKFIRVSLGGVRDEAEIRGHRRTYIGALPGKIIQSMKKAETINPLFLLDEVDKMSFDFRGDPSAALLEVLDPEQNHEFNDHYLEVDYDLSSVMFITTANIEEDIPRTLHDRMEVIRLPGYTREEKIEIAIRFLIPKQVKEHGLSRRNIHFSRELISSMIEDYTREAGVRDLERLLAKICRKVTRKMVHKKKKWKEEITLEKMREYLGPSRYQKMKPHKEDEIGVATGLAWTEMGGEILPTETSIVKGKGSLILTGQLGDVMQESAKAALTYIRSRYRRYKLRSNFYSDVDIHIHIPEGAIPKDGPSAGITLATSILSALTKRSVRQDVAMTGEITLRGRVLRIGGLKEKVLAAHRAGIQNIILPRENSEELEEIPSEVREDINFILVNNLDEALETVLKKRRKKSAAKSKTSRKKTVKNKDNNLRKQSQKRTSLGIQGNP